MGFESRAEAARSRSIVRACSSWVPCEKLSRATSIPARISRSIISAESLAGPRVHTILALRKFMVLSEPILPGRGERSLQPTSWRRSPRPHDTGTPHLCESSPREFVHHLHAFAHHRPRSEGKDPGHRPEPCGGGGSRNPWLPWKEREERWPLENPAE